MKASSIIMKGFTKDNASGKAGSDFTRENCKENSQESLQKLSAEKMGIQKISSEKAGSERISSEKINSEKISSEKIVVKRMTKQRRIIKEILCNSKQHPTAEAIYEEARKVLPDISLGTVYRNLQVLLEENAIIELSYGKKFSRFDGNLLPHYHFVCEECGKVYDVDMPFCQEVMEDAKKYVDGQLNYHRLEFYGICSDCQKKLNKVAN